jgi:DNA-binding SARP family transcriptional activator
VLRMLALYRSGHQAEALKAYQQLRAILVDELGIEPCTELRELHQQILAQDPAAAAAPAVAAAPRRACPAHGPTARPVAGRAKVRCAGATSQHVARNHHGGRAGTTDTTRLTGPNWPI